ncbi:MAG TPA: glycosyltransferase [Gemmatimonadaceae bacterium]|nr:glycosyltransferase [Gemmatimonadaceae bacterium]
MISFIVPAYNEEQHLARALGAIHDAAATTGERYEIVVADDASTDRTADIAAAVGARVVRVQKRQIAATRNAGAQAASGNILFFVDADTMVTPDIVGAALRALDDGAVGGGALIRFDGPQPFYFRAMTEVAVLVSRVMRLAFGCFMFVKREAFDAVGGFDERLFAGEELALSRALKGRGRFVILAQRVITSGRKSRAHTAREVWRALGLAGLQMVGLKRSRQGLDTWYGGRRHDPGSPH